MNFFTPFYSVKCAKIEFFVSLNRFYRNVYGMFNKNIKEVLHMVIVHRANYKLLIGKQ